MDSENQRFSQHNLNNRFSLQPSEVSTSYGSSGLSGPESLIIPPNYLSSSSEAEERHERPLSNLFAPNLDDPPQKSEAVTRMVSHVSSNIPRRMHAFLIQTKRRFHGIVSAFDREKDAA
jgi:hypothetical protein